MPPQPLAMTELSVEPLPFHPAQIWQWAEGYIAVGIDGEFLKLDSKLQKIGEVRKPFPCPLQSTALLGKELIVTWVDHELMLARMASFELDKGFEDGSDRGELRTRTSIDSAIHPSTSTLNITQFSFDGLFFQAFFPFDMEISSLRWYTVTSTD